MIDEQGIVRHRHDHLLGLDYQSVDELKAALEALPCPAASVIHGAGGLALAARPLLARSPGIQLRQLQLEAARRLARLR